MVRDFISGHSGESASRIKLNLAIKLPKDVREALAKANQLRSEAEMARKAAAIETSRAAQLLKDDGLTVRDIGLALGLSFQRAQQLLKRDTP
jgi:predicted phosphoribosyltransferase